MEPILSFKAQVHKAQSDEQIPKVDSVVNHPHYATLPPRFQPRFPLTDSLAKAISKTDPDIRTIK
jgi:hypothetical protein